MVRKVKVFVDENSKNFNWALGLVGNGRDERGSRGRELPDLVRYPEGTPAFADRFG